MEKYLKIAILSITNWLSVIHSQTLTSALLIPLHLKSVLSKRETKLISDHRLTLPAWHGENICYMYKFMKLQSIMLSDTLSAVLHVPLVDKSLQFHLFRIHNIPLDHCYVRQCSLVLKIVLYFFNCLGLNTHFISLYGALSLHNCSSSGLLVFACLGRIN